MLRMIVAGLLLLAAGCARIPAPGTPGFVNPWASFHSPVVGPPESIGSHAAGCLVGGVALPAAGTGYQRVSPRLNRQYGHPALVDFLANLGRAVRKAKERPFFVADIGMPRGGPTLSGHASHQIGLDVDIWFRRTADARDPRAIGPDQLSLLRRVAREDAVERVFVNPAIKKKICAENANGAWIRKIRPWYGHETHFHVRLKCPPANARCIPGEPLPEGSGCDASLAWWDTDEARLEDVARTQKPLELPDLPAGCTSVLAVPEIAIPRAAPGVDF